MKKQLSFTARLAAVLVLSITLLLLASFHGAAQQASTASHDGRHDFDFNFGTWRTHIKRLDHPLSGSKTWIKMEGTVTVTKIWGGGGQIEQIAADGPSGHWEGMTLFLYNPQAHQWSQIFAGRANGTQEPAIIGEFKNGTGELYGQDTFNGRTILTRGIWSEIKPNSHKFEQAFSADGGKTWEVNFSASLDRLK